MKTKSPMKDHWNHLYDSVETNMLGWFEATPEKSLNLISECKLSKDDLILDVGTGASTLIDSLLDEGYTNIVATDLSEIALQKSQARLGSKKAAKVHWITDDISKPAHVQKLESVTLWHDRAVLHFLLEEQQRKAYHATLDKVLKPEGYVIIAAFSLKGAKKCSGLDLQRYDEKMLARFLGADFELTEHLDHTYHQPSGAPRPYVYTLFRRIQ